MGRIDPNQVSMNDLPLNSYGSGQDIKIIQSPKKTTDSIEINETDKNMKSMSESTNLDAQLLD